MKITRENLKNIVREAMVEESAYQEFFKKALEKTGKSIPEMSEEEKKAFFNKIDKSWNGKGEKKEIVETELEEAQSPAQKAAFAKMLAKKDGKDESTDDEKEEVKESVVNEAKAKFKKDDLVYNKRTKTVGIVRDVFKDGGGDLRTDADGVVNIDELEKYNPIKNKHQNNAKVAPSTEKEVSKRGLFNPFKNESVIKEGFATWEMSFSDMTLNGVKLSKKNKYKVKARNTVEAIKKAAKMAGLKGEDWIATQTNYLKKIG